MHKYPLPQLPHMTFIRVPELPQKELVPGYHVRFVHSENMTFAHWEVDEGATLPLHSHPHEQVAHVLEGTFELQVGGETKVVEPGDVAIIPGGVEHTGTAITKCRLMDVFYPAREDYKQ